MNKSKKLAGKIKEFAENENLDLTALILLFKKSFQYNCVVDLGTDVDNTFTCTLPLTPCEPEYYKTKKRIVEKAKEIFEEFKHLEWGDVKDDIYRLFGK